MYRYTEAELVKMETEAKRAAAAKEKQDDALRARHAEEEAAENEAMERATRAKAARDEAGAEREAAMDAAQKVAEAARLRRVEEMRANKRAADEVRGCTSLILLTLCHERRVSTRERRGGCWRCDAARRVFA